MTKKEMVLAEVTKESTLDEIKAACVKTLVRVGFRKDEPGFNNEYYDLLTEVLYELATR